MVVAHSEAIECNYFSNTIKLSCSERHNIGSTGLLERFLQRRKEKCLYLIVLEWGFNHTYLLYIIENFGILQALQILKTTNKA